eukprot:1151913-Pelagomonas_calceolata.AAC.14
MMRLRGWCPQAVTEATGVPVTALDNQSAHQLVALEQTLSKVWVSVGAMMMTMVVVVVVLGQDAAVRAVASAVRLWRMGLLQADHRPAASFVFRGPPGVGKSLMCKVGRLACSVVLARSLCARLAGFRAKGMAFVCVCVFFSKRPLAPGGEAREQGMTEQGPCGQGPVVRVGVRVVTRRFSLDMKLYGCSTMVGKWCTDRGREHKEGVRKHSVPWPPLRRYWRKINWYMRCAAVVASMLAKLSFELVSFLKPRSSLTLTVSYPPNVIRAQELAQHVMGPPLPSLFTLFFLTLTVSYPQIVIRSQELAHHVMGDEQALIRLQVRGACTRAEMLSYFRAPAP